MIKIKTKSKTPEVKTHITEIPDGETFIGRICGYRDRLFIKIAGKIWSLTGTFKEGDCWTLCVIRGYQPVNLIVTPEPKL